MSYLQFGGRRQNLKSSSLENLKIWNVLYVAGPTTLDELRILDSFTFPSDPSKNVFDLSANKRFFELKAATENVSRVPIEYFDVSSINITGSFQTTGEIDGGFTKVTVDKNIEWSLIESSDNLILFADKGNNYTDISGQSNLAVGYLALKDFSGNNNIVLGTLKTSGNYYSGDNNIILGKNTTDSDISNSIILGNNVADLCNNSIYLGNDTHEELYTYSNLNVYNGVKFGEDSTEKKFIFDNMGIGLINSVSTNSPLVIQGLSGENTQGYTKYFGVNNSIVLKSGKNTDGDYDTSYNWEIVLQGDDNTSKLFGWQKALTFIAPSGRSYYLRDDAFNDASFSTGGVPIFDASATDASGLNFASSDGSSLVSGLSFTGQHSVLMENSNTNNVGKIVVSLGTYNNFTSGIYTNKPNMNESLPSVGFTTKKNDKRCFGVISKSTKIDEFKTRSVYNEGAWSVELNKNLLKNRCWVNSIGEGAVLVTNANGNFENGDFITTSEDAGYGMKQDDDLLHNYTVAKITENMDFTGYRAYDLLLGGVSRKVCLVGCTYHCG
tara:strand:- start:8888 stop:10543 length:1656 start_codon:yes stop_codon:yes gene_type:complete